MVRPMTVILWKARHPDLHDKAAARETQRLAEKFVTGRTGKDVLMPRVREVAAGGKCEGWTQVLLALELEDVDVSPLRIWGTTKDKSEIDRLCARARGRSSRFAPSRFGGRTERP